MTETKTKTEPKSKQRSYFSQDILHRYVLDDGESFIEHKKLDEGTFQEYQDLTSRIRLDRDGESTEVDMALGRQRKFLLENLVESWNLVDDSGKPIKFTVKTLFELPPEVIGKLVTDIYEFNPILGAGETDEEGKD